MAIFVYKFWSSYCKYKNIPILIFAILPCIFLFYLLLLQSDKINGCTLSSHHHLFFTFTIFISRLKEFCSLITSFFSCVIEELDGFNICGLLSILQHPFSDLDRYSCLLRTNEHQRCFAVIYFEISGLRQCCSC